MATQKELYGVARASFNSAIGALGPDPDTSNPAMLHLLRGLAYLAQGLQESSLATANPMSLVPPKPK